MMSPHEMCSKCLWGIWCTSQHRAHCCSCQARTRCSSLGRLDPLPADKGLCRKHCRLPRRSPHENRSRFPSGNAGTRTDSKHPRCRSRTPVSMLGRWSSKVNLPICSKCQPGSFGRHQSLSRPPPHCRCRDRSGCTPTSWPCPQHPSICRPGSPGTGRGRWHPSPDSRCRPRTEYKHPGRWRPRPSSTSPCGKPCIAGHRSVLAYLPNVQQGRRGRSLDQVLQPASSTFPPRTSGRCRRRVHPSHR